MGAQDSWLLRMTCRDGDKSQGATRSLQFPGACSPVQPHIFLRHLSLRPPVPSWDTYTQLSPKTVTQRLEFLTYNSVFWDLQPGFAGSETPGKHCCSDQTQMKESP